jgi:hypothetical protein
MSLPIFSAHSRGEGEMEQDLDKKKRKEDEKMREYFRTIGARQRFYGQPPTPASQPVTQQSDKPANKQDDAKARALVRAISFS